MAIGVATAMRMLSQNGGMARWYLGVLVAAGALHAAEPDNAKPYVPEFEFPAPLNAVSVAAANRGLALTGFDAALERKNPSTVGDQVTALVSLLDDKELTQWVVNVAWAELTADERKKQPPPSATLYTNTGTEIAVRATRAVLAVRVLGPFKRTDDTNDRGMRFGDQSARVNVNADFLSLGLDRACEAVMAVNAAKLENAALEPLAWSVRPQPFPPEVTGPTRERALAIGLTPERERALAGANPALREFFHVISRTPGLQDILKSVIDVPWWTVIKQHGNVPIAVTPQFKLARPVAAHGPQATGVTASSYTIPFVLFIGDKSALVGKLAVASPQRPLLVSAGILGVAACAPDGKGPRIMLQIVSARMAAECR